LEGFKKITTEEYVKKFMALFPNGGTISFMKELVVSILVAAAA
jgi:hypothetical protein